MGKGTKPSKPKPVAKEPSSTGSVSSRVVASALIAVVAIVAALALPRARESGGGAKPRANSSGSSRDAFGPCTAAEFIGDAPVPGFHVVCLHASPEGGRNGGVRVVAHAEAAPGPAALDFTLAPTDATPRGLAAALEARLDLASRNPGARRPWAAYDIDGHPLHDLRPTEKAQPPGGGSLRRAKAAGTLFLFAGGTFVHPGVRVGHRAVLRGVTGAAERVDDGEGGGGGGGDNRTVVIETLSLSPLVFSIDGFLRADECDYIRTHSAPHMANSGVSLMDKDKGKAATEWRTSTTYFMPSPEHPAVLKPIDERVAQLTRQPKPHQELVQVLRYEQGQKYDAHHDFFNPSLYKGDQGTMRLIEHGARNRLATVLWYLSDVAEGGETIFPMEGGRAHPRSNAHCEDGLRVYPRQGRVIMFYSLKANGAHDDASLHGACPVVDGTKWAANKWVWNSPIGLGGY